jgi:pimeloyl-ACP methyl ester carboxylesterase
MTAADPIASGLRFHHHRVEVEDGVRLTVYDWDPGTGAAPLVFVAGWISVIEGWRPVLELLVRRRPVLYIETREKRSAVFERRRLRAADFRIARLGEDLIEICDRLDVDPDRRFFFASSMGSNAVLEAAKHRRLAGRGAFLIGPNAEFRFPAWGKALTFMPASIYHLARPLMVWYLERFRVNARQDPEQMARYRRTLRAAHPARLKLSARAVLGYSLFPGLETVEMPVAIAFAPSDTLHEGHDVDRIVGALPCGVAVACPSNTYMHTAAVAGELERFIHELQDA